MILAAILAATLAQPLELNHRAVRALEKSLDAHGPADPKVSLTIRADLVNEGQSLAALGPFEAYPLRMDVALEPATKRMRVATTSSIAGDFTFSDILTLTDGKGYSLTPEIRAYTEVTSEPPVLNRYLPARLVRQLLRNRAALRAVDDHTILAGAQTIHLDPKTNLLHRIVQVTPSGFGDAVRESIYEDYKRTGDVLLPSRLRVRTTTTVHGTLENVYRYEDVRTDAKLDDFVLPAEYKKADFSYRSAFEAKPLAKDVWLLENVTKTTGQWSYNILVVAFDDFVLVCEAPVGSETSERVIEKVRELAPGKPVRYLVQSHHHGDHIGGIRPYIAEGTTILTGATTKPLIEKLATAPFLLDPDRLHRAPKAPKIELVSEPRRIGDRVVVYNIGPNPHAKDMLIVHLPQEKILWQSDMINEGEYPENDSTRAFFEKVRELSYERVVGLHGKAR